MLSYLPKTRFRHEYVTVVPEGFRFRGHIFDSLNSFLKWFKDHYSDPVVAATPIASQQTSPNIRSLDTLRNSTELVGKSSFAQPDMVRPVPSPASHYPNTPGYQGGYVNTPYTPSSQTPFMTPYSGTPHSSQTPRNFVQNTPSPTASSSNAHFARPSLSVSKQMKDVGMRGRPDADHTQMGHTRSYLIPQNEGNDWQLASESWARRSTFAQGFMNKQPITNGSFDSANNNNNNYVVQKTDYSRRSFRSGDLQKNISNNPDSGISPRSTNLGDATPLYDEN